MSDSIAENLKADLLKSGSFEVLDVTLLRKIDPNIQFANLDAKNASAFASRLNCEVAVVGRFVVKKQGKNEIVAFEADGVDALESRSVVVKNESATINTGIFDTVDKLAQSISDELNAKLAPLDASEFKRDNKLEILIKRLEYPPTGFLDSLDLAGSAGAPPIRFEPKFDIDWFEYEVYVNYDQADGVEEYGIDYQYWGKRQKPMITAIEGICKSERCAFTGRNPILEIRNQKSKSDKDLVYRLKLHLPHRNGPIISRWWVSVGYPYAKSFSILGQSNPAALAANGKIPFDSMKGYAQLEFGLGTERWQFGKGFKWALVTQYFYGQGVLPEFTSDSGYSVKMNMLSLGGGLRFDRPTFIGSRYGFSPFIGFYMHYQRFFRDLLAGGLNAMALVPEVGINQYIRFGYKLRWRWVLTIAAGSFIYSGQNLSYARASVGVEYAFK